MQRLAEETRTATHAHSPAVHTPPPSPAPEPDDSSDIAPPLGAGVLFVLSLLWLAATMWSVRAAFAGDVADPAVFVSSVALMLPTIVVAALVAGAAAGLATASRLARPASSATRTVVRRLILGAAGGAALGLVIAAVILFTFGVTKAIGVIAATVGVAAVLAGLSAGLAAAPLAAGVAATLGVFICGAVLNLFQSPLKSLLGAGVSIASRSDAAKRFVFLSAFIAGLVAAVVAYLYLRRRESGRAWGWYLLAGATPGLVALFGELVTQLGGSSLFTLVGGFSDDDRAALSYVSGSRFVSGMLILFVGGIGAMILVGRTLRRPEESSPEESSQADAPAAAVRNGAAARKDDEARRAGSRAGDQRFDVDFDDENLDGVISEPTHHAAEPSRINPEEPKRADRVTDAT